MGLPRPPDLQRLVLLTGIHFQNLLAVTFKDACQRSAAFLLFEFVFQVAFTLEEVLGVVVVISLDL